MYLIGTALALLPTVSAVAAAIPHVAGLYEVVAKQTQNECDPLNTAPSSFTAIVSQQREFVTWEDSTLIEDRASLKSLGWTITQDAPIQGTVASDGSFILSTGFIMTHPTLGTAKMLGSISGEFSPRAVGGIATSVWIRELPPTRCAITMKFLGSKSSTPEPGDQP